MHRQKAIELIGVAKARGAILNASCREIGLCQRTLNCLRQAFVAVGEGMDRRKGSPRELAHRLSEEERQRILLTYNQPEYTSLPRGRSCPHWPIRTCLTPTEKSAATAPSPVFTGSCTRQGSANGGGGHVGLRSHGQCRA